jgi:hypothetical protein
VENKKKSVIMSCVVVAKKNESERKREKEAENGF